MIATFGRTFKMKSGMVESKQIFESLLKDKLVVVLEVVLAYIFAIVNSEVI